MTSIRAGQKRAGCAHSLGNLHLPRQFPFTHHLIERTPLALVSIDHQHCGSYSHTPVYVPVASNRLEDLQSCLI